MNEIDIVQVIPVGHENAVTGRRLAQMLGIKQRDVRRLISKARKDHVIINLQDGEGYFLPDTNETCHVHRWFNQESSRLRELDESLRGARKFLDNVGGIEDVPQ